MNYTYSIKQSPENSDFYGVIVEDKIKDEIRLIDGDISKDEALKLLKKCEIAQKILDNMCETMNSVFAEVINIAEVSRMSVSNQNALAANLRAMRERLNKEVLNGLTEF